MIVWTDAKRQSWKKELRRLVKQSGQNQAEVAQEMGRLISIREGVSVVEAAYIAPLSRFVNAKGSEISRWFELAEERLRPLARALKLNDELPLLELRLQILEGGQQKSVHPAFPNVELDIEWTIDGVHLKPFLDNHAGSIEVSCDDWTWQNIQPFIEDCEVVVTRGNGFELDVPSFGGILQQLDSFPASSKGRLNNLSNRWWSEFGLTFGDRLWVLKDLLSSDCWNGEKLSSGWPGVFSMVWKSRWVGGDQAICSIMWKIIYSDFTIDEWIQDSSWNIDQEEWLPQVPSLIQHVQSREPYRLLKVEEFLRALIPSGIANIQLEKFIEQGVVNRSGDLLKIHNPQRYLPFLKPEPKAENTDCFSQYWFRSLWWLVQCKDWDCVVEHVLVIYKKWSFEGSRALIFILSVVKYQEIKIDEEVVLFGSVEISSEIIIDAWKRVLLGCRNQLFVSYDHPQSWGVVPTLQTFSQRFVAILPELHSWSELEVGVGWLQSNQPELPLVHLAPFQKPPRVKSEWVKMDGLSSVPIWQVLDTRARVGDESAALLLAHGVESDRIGFIHPPVEIRLFWLARIPQGSLEVLLFQRLLVDYWEGENPDINIVLDVCQQIEVDTILRWMEGWVNPLFLAQNEDQGQTLARLSMDISSHFQRQKLLQKWMEILWSWLNESPLDGQFVCWKGRRVLLLYDAEEFMGVVVQILNYGIQQLQETQLSRTIFQTDFPADSVYQYPWWMRVWRLAKENLLAHRDRVIVQRWFEEAPTIDLDVERAILQDEELLSILWQQDALGQRRAELLRLAGLMSEVPYWAVAEANRLIELGGAWPKWISPYAKETKTLVIHMCSGDNIQDRLWWSRVYYQHNSNPNRILSECVEALEIDFFKWTTQFVTELGPNRTPRIDGNDLLRLLYKLQQDHPNQWNQSTRVRNALRRVWDTRWFSLNEEHVVRLLLLLRLESQKEEFVSLEMLATYWSQLSPSVQRLLMDDWKALQPTEVLENVIDHALVGQWALERLLILGHPRAIEHLETHVKSGRIDILQTALRNDIDSQRIINWLTVWMQNDNDALVTIRSNILGGLGRLRTDSIWQRWVRSFI